MSRGTWVAGLVVTVVIGVTFGWRAAHRAPRVLTIWNEAIRIVREIRGWTDDDRSADPAGFVESVERTVKGDIQQLDDLLDDLQLQNDAAERARIEKEEERKRLTELVDEFRREYQKDAFPCIVRGKAYTRDSLEAQVGVLLAELEAKHKGLRHLEAAQRQLVNEFAKLNAQRELIRTKHGLLPAQRSLIVAKGALGRDAALLAVTDKLDVESEQPRDKAPLWSFKEFQQQEERMESVGTTSLRIREFLAAKSDAKVSKELK